MSAPTEDSGQATGRTGAMVNIMVVSAMVALAMGGSIIFGKIMDSANRENAPAILENIASQVDAEAKGLPEGTLLKSVYSARYGVLDDNSVMDVSYNDPETGVLKATRSIEASSRYSSEVKGTVGDYTITYTDSDAQFTYDSTTGETVKEEKG